jgi:hypothetical protein
VTGNASPHRPTNKTDQTDQTNKRQQGAGLSASHTRPTILDRCAPRTVAAAAVSVERGVS